MEQIKEPKRNPLIVILLWTGVIGFGLLTFIKSADEMYQGYGNFEAIYTLLCFACVYGLISYNPKG
jgi:hypothetical protein